MPHNSSTPFESRLIAASRDTFVLRIWREDDEAGHRPWRGWVQHVQSGDECYVNSIHELLRFIEDRAGELGRPTTPHLK
ncbi:MAG: hypothetical protein GXP42_14315 [Chloroflexi bacterium]|nr:hypothetical protein [Chloroflexota bacterium]